MTDGVIKAMTTLYRMFSKEKLANQFLVNFKLTLTGLAKLLLLSALSHRRTDSA